MTKISIILPKNNLMQKYKTISIEVHFLSFYNFQNTLLC